MLLSPFLSLYIGYQPLLEVLQAEIPLFRPVMTSFFALYPWIRPGLAGTETGSAGRRPGLAGTGDFSPRLIMGTETEVRSQPTRLQSSVRHCVSLGIRRGGFQLPRPSASRRAAHRPFPITYSQSGRNRAECGLCTRWKTWQSMRTRTIAGAADDSL